MEFNIMKNYTEFTIEEMLKNLSDAYKNKKPFSSVAMGDGELIFLCCPEIMDTVNLDLYLHLNGVSSKMQELKKEMIKLIPENDFIITQSPANRDKDPRRNTDAWDWARFFSMCPELLEYYKVENAKLVFNVPGRYKMVTDGSLFNAIEGARVLLVGYHSPVVEERMKNPEFIKHYEKMNLHKINVVGSIGCGEFSSGDEVEDMIEKTKQFDFDVAIIAMGIPSNYFAPKLKQMGKIVVDIGHSMNGLAGKADINRMFMPLFDYNK